ncbi:hypothetical protein C8Q78DRAFT_994136 [Trametes maxima]|nr:hypothetical protein C8Q78DRAFT_994136 [Trametes maxima]
MTNPFLDGTTGAPPPSTKGPSNSPPTHQEKQAQNATLGSPASEGAALFQILCEMAATQRRMVEQLDAMAKEQRWQQDMMQRQLGIAERGELRAYNKETTRWRPMPLPDGEPYPAGLPFNFPESVFSLGEMSAQHVRILASLYGVNNGEPEQKLRDNLAILIASQRM